ncbi:MAG: hypothetical protein KIS85_06395 [Anaerolineales bacterium]|nr:hypothetical protein [Anaerolineales bacterium]
MNERIYRILVVALLAIIALGQFAPSLFGPGQACRDAIETAQSMLTSQRSRLNSLENAYTISVYTRAENINQQVLLANEQIFEAGILQLAQNYALLDLLANCR